MIECQGFTGDFIGELNLWAKANNVPLNVTFELTPFCNFSCVMCYIRLNKEQAEMQGKILSADEWLKIARQAKEMGTLSVSLTGGEPFLHPEFWQIYSELNKMGFLVSILSNGSSIDERAMENFKLYGTPYSVKLTAYGASDETYKKVCNSDDGFTRLSKAVDLLKSADVPLKMTSTIVRENACDLQEIYAFARSKGVPMQHTLSVLKSSRGAVNTAASSRFEFADFPEEMSIEMLEKSMFPPLKSPFAWCASYKKSLWVTWNGRLQLCSFLSEPSVKYNGNLSASHKELYSLLGAVKSPSECGDCEWKAFCQRCPGMLCAESGHPEKIDSGFCLMAENLQKVYLRKKGELI